MVEARRAARMRMSSATWKRYGYWGAAGGGEAGMKLDKERTLVNQKMGEKACIKKVGGGSRNVCENKSLNFLLSTGGPGMYMKIKDISDGNQEWLLITKIVRGVGWVQFAPRRDDC